MASLDGRYLIVVFLSLYYLLLLFTPAPTADQLWSWRGFPAALPPFRDAHCLIAGAESMRDGYDPIVSNPRDPDQVRANYPHVWFSTLLASGVRLGNTKTFGVLLALSFYGMVLLYAGRVTLFEGLIWSVLLCLPPSMLAVERGNNDLVVFDLLALALLARRIRSSVGTAVGYALIEVCAILKLFPITAISLALRGASRRSVAAMAVCLLVFVGYACAIHGQLSNIAAVMPEPYSLAFGARVLATRYNVTHVPMIPLIAPVIVAVAGAALAAIGAMLTPPLKYLSSSHLDGLTTGSALFVPVFILNNNYNYRLVFLLFTLPALCRLIRSPGRHGILGALMIGSILVGWAFSCESLSWFYHTKELANWTIFLGMSFLWVKCVGQTPSGNRLSYLPVTSETCSEKQA